MDANILNTIVTCNLLYLYMWWCKIKCCFDVSPVIVIWKTAELQANATFLIVHIYGMMHAVFYEEQQCS